MPVLFLTKSPSPKISHRGKLHKWFALRSMEKRGQSIKICWTVKITWQVEQRGACLSAPLVIRYLCVKCVWPIRKRVNIVLDLLSPWKWLQGETEGLIDFNLKLLARLDQCRCHCSLENFPIWDLTSDSGMFTGDTWASLVAALASTSASSFP